MPHEITAGLLVADRELYAQYRAEIEPLLREAGARFRYDLEVARTLKSEAGHEINRLFVLQFPGREAKEKFFADPRYQEIRARLFERSVQRFTIVGESGAQR